jgi:TRAP-type mannitol/chloroaromatic compound transport system permease large subunit
MHATNLAGASIWTQNLGQNTDVNCTPQTAGIASTPTIGAIGATLYAFARRQLNLSRLADTVRTVTKLTAMVFMLLLGATTFSLVFRGFGGDVYVTRLLTSLPGGTMGPVAAVMALCFGLGFFLDALEIMFLVVPIAMPPLLLLGVDPVWLAVLTAINLQTSFMLPPFGFALFFLRGVAPKSIATVEIYRGVLPFIAIQLVGLALVWGVPRIVTALPERMNAAATSVVTPRAPGSIPSIELPPEPDGEPAAVPRALRTKP